ncbi:hypothetical protein [Brevundimonas sp. LjRoot202]|uniref:hypothetical protein n=1 Tax=Brevundimonas sp. LjRoot202 TaxID=3342281 RepID=UPI003ECC60FD
MADHPEDDWRVTEGPAFGAEPEFELSDIRPGANFIVTGSMLRRITATVTASAPTVVESLDRTLPQLSGFLGIYDGHSGRTILPIKHGRAVELGPHRGVMALISPERYVIHLCLPTEQFAMLLPLLAPAPAAARLRIEVDRTLDQGLLDTQVHFWNDHLSPVILFNEFEISLPAPDGSYL